MVEPASTIGGGPVGGAVAPPGVDFLRQRNALARHVAPAAGGLHVEQLLALDRRMRHHLEHLPVRPDVVLVGGDVEVADQHVMRPVLRVQRRARFHLVEEGELVGELRIERRVGHVAAGRDVEVMQHQRRVEAGARAEFDRDVPRIDLVAEGANAGRLERHARDDGNAVIALLPVECDMLVAEALEALERKGIVRALGFLQAQHVRPRRLEKARDEIDPQPDRVDIPCREGQAHGEGLPLTVALHCLPDKENAAGAGYPRAGRKPAPTAAAPRSWCSRS